MSEYNTIETRRRSRSKTPFLRSTCDHEHCEHIGDEPHAHHHKKKVTSLGPNVNTIVEETVEVTSSSSVGTGKVSPSKMTQTKIKTSDYSSEESPEGKNKTSTRTLSTSAVTHLQQQKKIAEARSSTTAIKLGGATLATSTPKRNNFFTSFAAQYASKSAGEAHHNQNKQREQTQNVLNAEKELSNRKHKSLSGFLGNSSYSDRSLDGSDHIAYLEYKKAGEYWNTTPKTDYTYSELSPHRRVLAPGIIAMPNMSRQSLDNHHERISYMIQRNPAQEEHIRRRYESPKYYQNRSVEERLIYESGDEVDYSQYQPSYSYKHDESWFVRCITAIVTTITTAWSTITGSGSLDNGVGMYTHSNRMLYRTKLAQERRGFFGSIAHGIWSGFLSIMRHIYLFISYVLCFDTWLLKSSNAENKHKKRFLLFLLMILPLLLLSGTYYYLYPNEPFPPKSFSQYTLTLPEMPKIDMSKYVDEEKYTAYKLSAFRMIDDLRDYSNDYSLYLKTVAQNLLDEGRKMFQREEEYLPSAWWLLEAQDRMIITQHWNSLVPLSLLTTSLYTNLHALKSFLPLFTLSSQKTSQNIEDLKLPLSKSMASEEYENILNHINTYMQKLVEIKMQEQQQQQFAKSSSELNTKQVQLIVQIIKENLESFSKQQRSAATSGTLSDHDVNVIIQKVLLRLEDMTTVTQRTLTLSPENIDEIKKLIAQSIEANNHEHYKLIVQKLDLNVLIGKLLEAPLFTNYIQKEISSQLKDNLQENLLILQQAQSSGDDHYKLSLEQQKILIDNLNKDLAFIKLALNDKVSENEDLHYSVKQVQQTQNELLQRLEDLESTTDQKFAKLLQEITMKLTNLKDEQFQLLNQQVKLSLIEILGFKAKTKDGVQLSDLDLQNWVHNTFVAKDYLELRLAEINNRTNDKIKQEVDKSGMFLMRDISERLKQEIIISVESRQKESQAVLNGQIKEALSEHQVRNIVKSVLAIYDADKTGLVDFALESAGGQILSTRCTENYQTKTAQISVFGIPLWYPTNTPRIAISPNVQPGECWAFQGFPGFLVLKLNSLVYVTGFTLEHIPKTLAPNGRIDSAPRNFTVWGLEHEKDYKPILFGEYEYTDNDASLQYFPLQNKNIKRPYEIVELRIESNQGHPLYTCLYRFRVHGKPPAA